MNSNSLTIDNFRPLATLRPNSTAELGDIVRRAIAENAGLYPVGGGTMLHFGLPPTKPGFLVDMRGLDQVIDYPARDMTITVQAGITLAELQRTLERALAAGAPAVIEVRGAPGAETSPWSFIHPAAPTA